jgi:flagellar motor switch protein FliM
VSAKGSADATKKDAPKKKRPTPSKAAAKGKVDNPNEASGSGDAASAAADIDGLAPGRIRPLDFSQPTKFTTEIRRRITSAIEQFCEAASGRLSAELAVEVQLGIAEVDQHTWAASKARLPADAIAIAIEAKTIDRQMLLSIEQPLLLQALECLLGGQAAQAPSERHLTDVDWVLAKGLLDAIAGELSGTWGELGGPELSCGEIDLEADAGVLTPVGEPTFSVKLASEIDGQASAMSLLIPWSAIEPIADHIRGDADSPLVGDAHGPDALRRGLSGAKVLLRAEVGSAQMPIERMLELVPGAIAQLQGRAQDGVSLYAEGVLLGRGHPGRSGTRRAIKLESTSAAPTKADTYAQLGRAELDRARAHVSDALETPQGRAVLRSIFVRVWAELGRTHIPLKDALELSPGAVLELDQAAEAPIELFVNGLCFANGNLIVTGEGTWGLEVAALV